MFGVKLKVWGKYACFTRPEMKVERVSYDVITPSAARGIFESIYWKPSLAWRIDRITVLNPIRFKNIRRNELKGVMSERNVEQAMKGTGNAPFVYIEEQRQQRAAMVLADVAYVIDAHFDLTAKAGDTSPEDASPQKHKEIFGRRAAKGQCFQQPYLGTREFPAFFNLCNEEVISEIKGEKDLGWMLYDIDFDDNMTPYFYRPLMKDGVINVPSWEEVRRDITGTL